MWYSEIREHMNPTVYIETTVIGYLTSRPREDPIVAGHQNTTRDWWQTAADRFDLVASELVVQECSAGDQTAAGERLEALAEITLLPNDIRSRSTCRSPDRRSCRSKITSGRCTSYRLGRGKRYTISCVVELSAYRQCSRAIDNRKNMSRCRL